MRCSTGPGPFRSRSAWTAVRPVGGGWACFGFRRFPLVLVAVALEAPLRARSPCWLFLPGIDPRGPSLHACLPRREACFSRLRRGTGHVGGVLRAGKMAVDRSPRAVAAVPERGGRA